MANTNGNYQARDINSQAFTIGDYVFVRCLVQSITQANSSATVGSIADLINLLVINAGNVGEASNVTFSVSPVQCRKCGTAIGTQPSSTLLEFDISHHTFTVNDQVMVRCLVTQINPSPANGTGGAADTVVCTVEAPGNAGERTGIIFSVSPTQVRKAGNPQQA